METNNKSLEQVIKTVNDSLDAVLSYSQKNDYAGFNKYDALASPILLPLSFGNKYRGGWGVESYSLRLITDKFQLPYTSV